EDKLQLLGACIEIDHRISWRGAEDAGWFDPINVYLLTEDRENLLLEAGVAFLASTVSAQLASIVGNEASITRLLVTRNEPDCISNSPNLASQWGLERVYAPGAMNPLDFFEDTSSRLQMLSFGVERIAAPPGMKIPLGNERSIEVLRP